MTQNYTRKSKEERDAEMKNLIEKIQHEVEQFGDSKTFKKYLKTMSKFHNYSFNNTILIASQRPTATKVAGYTAWQKDFNRQVKKGEKGIRIFCPIKRSYDTENENGETEHVEYTGFRVASVFDLSQTEQIPDKPVVQLDYVTDLTGSVDNYNKIIEQLKMISPVPVEFQTTLTDGEMDGYYSRANDKIVIKNSMSEEMTVKTLIHEIAHAILHNSKRIEREELELSKTDKEVEAEATAYVVANYLGLDTSNYSVPYIAGWINKEDNTVINHLNSIRTAANQMIDTLETLN